MHVHEEQITFRPVQERDISGLLEIYLYYIRNSTVTFQIAEIGIDEMRALVTPENAGYRSFSIFAGCELCGYASYHKYREREAFSKTAEISIYLKNKYAGCGIGSKALQMLEPLAKNAGVHTLLALVCHENTESIRLFKRSGYMMQSCLKEVGYKFGRYLDLVILQKFI